MTIRILNVKDRLQIFLRLPFLFALSTLILNDHWLKQAHPSWLTGKLSDFSGLFVFVIFLFVILGQRVQTIKNLQALHVLVALIFVVWKLAPVEIFTHWLSAATGLAMPNRVKDATDLIALVMLLVSYRWIVPSLMSSSIRPQPLFARKVITLMVLLISGWSIMATPPPRPPQWTDLHYHSNKGTKHYYRISLSDGKCTLEVKGRVNWYDRDVFQLFILANYRKRESSNFKFIPTSLKFILHGKELKYFGGIEINNPDSKERREYITPSTEWNYYHIIRGKDDPIWRENRGTSRNFDFEIVFDSFVFYKDSVIFIDTIRGEL